MNPKYPMAEGQDKHVLPLSMFRRVGTTVYISGHGAVDENGSYAGDTLETQMRWTMVNFERTLTQAGLTFADLIMVRAYLQHSEDIPLYNKLYREFFTEPYPARTTLTECLPPGLLFEIDAVGVCPG